MKEQIEYNMKEFLETLEYQGEPALDSVLVSHGDKPEGSSVGIINWNNPVKRVTKALRGQHIMIESEGNITLIFKIDDSLQGGRQDASDRNSRISDHIVNSLFKYPSLDGRIPGQVLPVSLNGDLFQLDGEGTLFYKSDLVVSYKGRWIPPGNIDLQEPEHEP